MFKYFSKNLQIFLFLSDSHTSVDIQGAKNVSFTTFITGIVRRKQFVGGNCKIAGDVIQERSLQALAFIAKRSGSRVLALVLLKSP